MTRVAKPQGHRIKGFVRCVARGFAPLKKWCLTPFLFFFVIPPLWADQPVMKTLSAHVIHAAEDSLSIAVDFRHPATDKVHRLIFHKDNESGLSGMKSLRDLRPGQVVSIDYVEDSSGKKMIRRIAKVKLSGPPPGLEKFNGI
ncbi:MAG: hypothetical protein BWY44_00712 [Candidatus Omnitrophica bacterium ADurb.Bin292]|nr:MAG: hypothetical protein BWY44_00712 [Candidatus Omnitrophica bacterium ADurb.Bin292]